MTSTEESAQVDTAALGETIPFPRQAGAGPDKRVGVMIATPKRDFPKDPREQMKALPRWVGSALRELHNHPFYRFEFIAAVGGICRARNFAVHDFLKTDNTWLLWVDDDLWPAEYTPGQAVLRLLGHKQPIVGGLYCKRTKRPSWACNFMPLAELQPKADGLLQVVELATGFKLYHRKVFTELKRLFVDEVKPETGHETLQYVERETGESMCAFHQQRIVERDMPPEDYFLDFLCRNVKIGILADTKLRLHHRDADGTLYPDAWPAIPGVD